MSVPRKKDPILIDLSLDCETTLPPERISPANRISIEGVEAFDYLVYPLPDQLADKFCAIMELRPGGYPSSRMKDLVDVIFYANNKAFSLRQLRNAILSECRKRGMAVPKRFEPPDVWRDRFGAFAKGKLDRDLTDFDAASELASRFFNPALEMCDEDCVWSPALTCWTKDVVR